MKRATIYNKYFMQWASISIHALMKRATEGDGDNTSDDFISIHALMKRATGSKKDISNPKLYFNPRPHEEGDHIQ